MRAAILLGLSAVLFGAEQPILVVNSVGHQGTVKSLVFAARGKYLLSGGEDKVVRVWETATGRVLRSFRGQIGDGQDGKIYAMALSPDGSLLAVGGYLRQGRGAYIRLVKLDTGEVAGLLVGHLDVVSALAFSPDGRTLASASADGTVRLWNLARNGEAAVLTDQPGAVSTVAYSPDGTRVASGGVDRVVRLWDAAAGKLMGRLQGHTDQISSVVFTSDGRSLLSSAEDGQILRWDARLGGRLLAKLGTQGVGGGNLTLAPGGRFLTSSSYREAGDYRHVAEVRRVEDGRVLGTFPRHDRGISAIALSPDGQIAATAGGLRNEIRLWNPSSGAPLATVVGAGSPVFQVGFGEDGNSVAFGNRLLAGPRPNAWGALERTMVIREGGRYDLREGPDVNRAPTRYLTADVSAGGKQLRVAPGRVDTLGTLEVLRGGAVAARIERDERSGYRHSAFTFTHDGRFVVTGGFGGILTLFEADTGRKVGDLVGHTGDIWSVAVSPDNALLASGSDDQTIRLWDLRTQKNLLTIFVPQDGQWVAWTPHGYYTCHRNGDRYIGWHINNGPLKAADWFSAGRFVAEFFKPAVVARFLELREIGAAVSKVNASTPAPEPVRSPSTVAELMPPIVVIESPAAREETSVSQPTIALAARARSLTPIRKWIVTVNNEPVYEQKGSAADERISIKVPLKPGRNVVAVHADNGKTDSDARTLLFQGANREDERKPALAVLAVGLSKYRKGAFNLKYGDKDASAIAERFKAQEGPLYSKVDVRLLLNQQATQSEILRGLGWLASPKTAGPRDIRVAFFAGHAAVAGDRGYFFWSYDHDPDDVAEAIDVNWRLITGLLNTIEGRTVLMVDTCHAAAMVRPGTRGVRPDEMSRLVKEVVRPGLTLALYAAAAPSEVAREDASWNGGHGALTAAILNAFTPTPARRGTLVTTEELGDTVRRAVREMTGDAQRAWHELEPLDARHFPLYQLP